MEFDISPFSALRSAPLYRSRLYDLSLSQAYSESAAKTRLASYMSHLNHGDDLDGVKDKRLRKDKAMRNQ